MNRWQRLACFADTGFFYALVDAGDRWHAETTAILRQIQQQGRPVVTTPLVVAEAHALMLYRLGHGVAMQWLTALEEWVELIEVQSLHCQRAIEILAQYNNQLFSYTDAISFSVLEAYALPIALSVDKHFLVFRGSYLTLPLAGTLLPAPE
jgi:predicted nucleic acid-binding protein